ncbi:MAG: hydrogenase maturation protease [Alphaproteobacteria bacterium]|nr:hydrogenase maturation protease [Alphaproteobacteria bacterium]
MSSDRPRCIVIGIGNPDRGDDAAGPAVVRSLRDGVTAAPDLDCRTAPAVPAVRSVIIEHHGEATALIPEMTAADELFLVDACVSGAPPGTIHRFDVSTVPMPALASGYSTHGFGLAAAVELARALGLLPRRSIVYAIEGTSFDRGAALSPLVADAAAEVVWRLRAEIDGEGTAPCGGDCRGVACHE